MRRIKNRFEVFDLHVFSLCLSESNHVFNAAQFETLEVSSPFVEDFNDPKDAGNHFG